MGQTRNSIARLVNTGPATNDLSFDGSTITWLRGGTAPEVWRTAFDYSPRRLPRISRLVFTGSVRSRTDW